jgi:hypothetical protein
MLPFQFWAKVVTEQNDNFVEQKLVANAKAALDVL